jgi:cytoskeletal protein RodZ
MGQKSKRFTSELFIGARLGAVRTDAKISLEQAAKDTRIRVQRLREIEVDDFSGFAHPTYARLFLLDYAAYLDVPADEIRPLLPDQTKAASAGFQYLDVLGGVSGHPVGSGRSKRRPVPVIGLLAGVFILFLILIGSIYLWSTMRKIERISARTTEEAQPASEPVPAETPTPSPEPTPEPTPAETPESLWEMAPPADPQPSLTPETEPNL